MTELPAVSSFAEPCPDCQQPILWPWTNASSGVNRMPCDAEPVGVAGNVLISVDPANPERIVCDVIGNGARGRAHCRRLAAGGHPIYWHHRLTCTKADKWARPQKRPVPAVSTAGDLGELEKGLF
jgi:hypothetical protein